MVPPSPEDLNLLGGVSKESRNILHGDCIPHSSLTLNPEAYIPYEPQVSKASKVPAEASLGCPTSLWIPPGSVGPKGPSTQIIHNLGPNERLYRYLEP